MKNHIQEFEKLVEKILEANSFKITEKLAFNKGYDFEALLHNDKWAVEVKFYRTSRPQPSLIKSAAQQLLLAASKSRIKKAMLILSCYLDIELRQSLEDEFSIAFVDKVDLSLWARTSPLLIF